MGRAATRASRHLPQRSSTAAALRHEQQTSPRRVAGSKIFFCLLLNKPDAILQRDLHLRKARRFSSGSKASYLRMFSFLMMCGTSSNSRGFFECTPSASSLAIEVDASRLQPSTQMVVSSSHSSTSRREAAAP